MKTHISSAEKRHDVGGIGVVVVDMRALRGRRESSNLDKVHTTSREHHALGPTSVFFHSVWLNIAE
jgi:hypothetical protein